MKNSLHITDEDLKLVALDKASPSAQTLVEDHVSRCERCQQRLLELAVDSDWRGSIIENCNSFRHEMENECSTMFDANECSGLSAPTGDAFDLQTVDQMLEEVMAPPTHPEMLGRLGRYDIEGVIGCGGMGVVLKGFDRDLYRPVAIKMILPRLSKNGTAKQRFAREARAAAVVLHPNVIAIYGIETTNDVPWIAMPLILGPTLKALVKERGPLPERDIVQIGKQIASGLAAAHSQGLVHRDIKPENILVDNDVNRVVITDFGLARQLSDEPMTQTGFLAGTIAYMSPEQSRGAEIDGRSDLFSLGGLLYFLATGQSPFSGHSPMGVIHAVGHKPHVRVQALNNEISGTLAEVIDRLLEKEPSNRFQSAVEVETFLNDYLFHLQQPLLGIKPSLSSATGTSMNNPVAAKPKLFFANLSASNRSFTNSLWLIWGLSIAMAGGAWWGIGAWQAASKPLVDGSRELPSSTAADNATAVGTKLNQESIQEQDTLRPKLIPYSEVSELDEQLDGWLATHRQGWKELGKDPSLTVKKIEALRQKTLDKFPPMSKFQPSHIRKIKMAGLLQFGPAREQAIERIGQFADDETEQGAMAAYLMFDVAVQYPFYGYPEGETEADRLSKRQKALAHLLAHPKLESVFEADKKLEMFTFLRRMNSPETWQQYPEQMIQLKELLISSGQTSVHSEYVDCFEVVKAATGMSGEELEATRKQLLEFANRELKRLKSMTQVDTEFHQHLISSLEGQIEFLESVAGSGTLIGTVAPELEFLWSSNEAIKAWKDIRGKVCVLYFSTAGCGPCVKSVPKLIELNKTIASHGAMAEKVSFIGITCQQGIVPLKAGAADCKDDFPRECELMLQYIDESEINWPIVFTKETVFNPAFGARSVPHMVVLDSEGAIRDYFNPFEVDAAEMLKRIGAIVN